MSGRDEVAVTPDDIAFAEEFGNVWLDGSAMAKTVLAAKLAKYRSTLKPADTIAGASGEVDPDSASDEYVAQYVMSTEGADYEPTEWDRSLIQDALAGFIADHWPRATAGDTLSAVASISGSTTCPICGIDTPHPHSAEEVRQWQAREIFVDKSWQDFQRLMQAALDGTFKPPINCGCEAEDGSRPDPECLFCGHPPRMDRSVFDGRKPRT